MPIKFTFPCVQASNGETIPFSPDHFAGTLVRAGVAPAAALQAAATVHGVLQGAGIQVVSTDTLRAATGEILTHRDALDIEAIHRILVQWPSRLQPIISFSQLAVHLDGKPSERSDWGAVSVRYPPSNALAYFNVAVEGRWVIHNAPLFPPLDGQPVETLFYFDLGVKPGLSVSNLHVATSLSRNIASQAPNVYSIMPVQRITEIYWTNFSDQLYPALGSPPPAYIGGPLDNVFYCRNDYPNQPCGKNECAPTAVSNSLQWLNREYGLNIEPSKLAINYWKTALGWGGDGVTHGAWADLKKKFVDNKDNGIPIDSTKESGGHAAQVLDQFNGKNASKTPQAVEVDIGSHVASVTCMGGPDAHGNYHLMAASDTAQQGQGAAGNPQIQQIEITPNGDVVNGPPWAQGQKVQNFVIQCPHPGKF